MENYSKQNPIKIELKSYGLTSGHRDQNERLNENTLYMISWCRSIYDLTHIICFKTLYKNEKNHNIVCSLLLFKHFIGTALNNSEISNLSIYTC